MAGFLGIIIVLIATLLVGLANLRNVSATSEAVAHTYAVKVGLEHLVATLVEPKLESVDSSSQETPATSNPMTEPGPGFRPTSHRFAR